jgi:hypothetical protein
MKIMINACSGGFEFSACAMDQYSKKHPEIGKLELFNIKNDIYVPYELTYHRRTDLELISIVEELGAAADGPYTWIRVVDIPDETTDWSITKCDDGSEELVYVVGGKLNYISYGF